jgi:hypothetical protein
MAMPFGNRAQGGVVFPLKSATLVSFAKAISTACLIFYSLWIIHPIKMVSRNTMSHWYLE